jgi:hypothetical protein
MEAWALIVMLAMTPPSPLEPAPRPWPCRVAVPSGGPAMLPMLWSGSTHFRRQCTRIAEGGVVVVVQWADGRLPADHNAETRVLRDRGRVFRAVVRLARRGEPAIQLAHELEHVLEALEAVADTGNAGGWRTRAGATETHRARRVEAAVRQELQTGAITPALAGR